MDIQVRKLEKEDSLSQVSRLIYETDNFIFPHFFGHNVTLAKQILTCMIDKDTIYNRENIYVALVDEQIVGISVIAPSPVSINLGAFFEAFECAGATEEIDDAFQSVMKEYFIPMESHPDGYYIACLCVDEQYRGKGIASAMIGQILASHYGESDVYLDCLTDNQAAISVYESHGFERLFEFSGFTSMPYYKMIKRAPKIEMPEESESEN